MHVPISRSTAYVQTDYFETMAKYVDFTSILVFMSTLTSSTVPEMDMHIEFMFCYWNSVYVSYIVMCAHNSTSPIS